MRIGELATRTGARAGTIRYWEGQAVLPEPDRTPAGYRDYNERAVERIAFIRQAQTARLTLEHIGQILDISDGGSPPCDHVAGAVTQRLAEVDARITELEATRDRLRRLAAKAATQDPADCVGICSIIAGSADEAS